MWLLEHPGDPSFSSTCRAQICAGKEKHFKVFLAYPLSVHNSDLAVVLFAAES